MTESGADPGSAEISQAFATIDHGVLLSIGMLDAAGDTARTVRLGQ